MKKMKTKTVVALLIAISILQNVNAQETSNNGVNQPASNSKFSPAKVTITGKIFERDSALHQDGKTWNLVTELNKYSDEFNLKLCLFEVILTPISSGGLVNPYNKLKEVSNVKITIKEVTRPHYFIYTISDVDASKKYVVAFIAIRKSAINVYDPIIPPNNIRIAGAIFANSVISKQTTDTVDPTTDLTSNEFIKNISFNKFDPSIH
jgi:hypothetical protein